MKSTFHKTTYEKRHTKPCRFFQKGICPLSADRCDFAHVKIHILPVGYSPGHLKPPQAGQCDHNESLQPAVPMTPIENGMPNLHAAPEAMTPSSNDVVTVAQSAVTQVPYSPKLYTHKPVLLPPVRREPNVNVAGSASVSSGDLAQLIFRDGDSSPTSDVPSLSDGDSEPPSAPCEAPELAERWPGLPSVSSPMVYHHPSPGLFYPGSSFTHPAYRLWIPPKQATHSESRRQGMSTRKLKALKTKQCKFFKKDGRCPQGSLCTFIHDSSRAPQSEQESPSDSSSQSASEPHSKAHEDREQNIFPITWRVIGGGVMMGGQREVCAHYKDGVCPYGDDCSSTHPWEDDAQTSTSPTPTPRAPHFPNAQMHAGADKSAEQPLGSGNELPPRPFSTPPRIICHADPATLGDNAQSMK